jgi:hypothetical protein
MIGINLTVAPHVIFPESMLGVDPWVYRNYNTQLLNSGSFIEGWSYQFLPVFDLVIGSTRLITDLSYKWASVISIGLIQVVSCAGFTYLLGKRLVNVRTGLLAALLLITSNHFINLCWAPIATSIAGILLLSIVYILFAQHKNPNSNYIFIILLLFTALIMAHTVTALCMAILLAIYWATAHVYPSLKRREKIPLVNVTLLFIFIIGMISWWMFASGHFTRVIKTIKWALDLDSLAFGSESIAIPIQIQNYLSNVPLVQQYLYHAGMLLFFALAIFGGLSMISKRYIRYEYLAFILGGFSILISGFIPFGSAMGIMHRRWYYSQILLALPVAITILKISQMKPNNIYKFSSLVATIVLLSWLSLLSPAANVFSNGYADSLTYRKALTASEIQAVHTSYNILKRPIGTDVYYYSRIKDIYPNNDVTNQDSYNISGALLTAIFKDSADGIILIRNEIMNNAFSISGNVYKLDYNPLETLSKQRASKIYSNREVNGFVFYNRPF